MKKKKFIKKAMAVLLSVAMVLSAAGCGGKTADNGTASQTAGTETRKVQRRRGAGRMLWSHTLLPGPISGPPIRIQIWWKRK